MLKNRNEGGYSLLIVLLFIVIIMIVSSTFMMASISNAKQEKKVDMNNLAVVAAEMGVDYYKTFVFNEFNVKNKELLTQAQNEINRLINSREYPNMNSGEIAQNLEVIRQNLKISLRDHFNKEMLELHPPKNISTEMKFDDLVSYNASIVEDGVLVKGTVIGHNLDNRKSLNFDITFRIPKLKLGAVDGGSGGSGGSGTGNNGTIDMYNLYPSTNGIPNCGGSLKDKKCIGTKDTNFGDLSNSTIYFPTGHTNGNTNNVNLGGSKIYSNGPISIVNNANNIQNVSFFVNGGFTVAKNVNGNKGLTNSSILVNGAMSTKHLLLTNSSVIVRGALKVDGKLELYSNSKVCVAGSVSITKKINLSSGQIIVWGSIDDNAGGKVKTVNSEAELWRACGIGNNNESPAPPTVAPIELDWVEPVINVEYY